jgi:N-acetylneuraminate synthase/N,N'-diacetyllegionaminate synthase
MSKIFLKNREISNEKPVFVIAEAGVNHNNKLSLALKMVDIAKKAGADAIKFQTFKADKIQMKNSVKPNYQKKIKNANYYEIIKSLETDFDDQKKIFEYCNKKGIIFLSTPYDEDSVDFLDSLGVLAFKISSSDLTNHFLLKHVSKKRKPILLSTGLADSQLVDAAIDLFKKEKMMKKLILLHTTSDYPAQNDQVNLQVIPEYIKKYKILIGYSDHTQYDVASLGAISLGARVLEKHFTTSRNLSGPDQMSSLEPKELEEWIKKIRLIETCLGNSKKIITKSEAKNLTMRKVLVLSPAKKGTVISHDILIALRGKKTGILPIEKNISKIIGKKLSKDIIKVEEFSWEMI